MTTEKPKIELFNKRITDENYKLIEDCLKEIKKDIRTLPCKNVGEGCLQEKPLKELDQKIKQLTDLHEKDIDPLISSNILLNEKNDQIQKLLKEIHRVLNKTSDKVDELQIEVTANNLETTKDMAALKLSLVTQLTQVVSNRDAVHSSKTETRTIIAWTIGLIISTITIFTFLKNFIL